MKYILEDEAINDNGCFATGGIGSSIGCQRSQLSHYEEIIDEPRRCLRKIHGVTWLGHVLQDRDRTKCITQESFFCDFSIRRGEGLHLHFELARGSGRRRHWLGCFLIRHMTWASTVKKVPLTSISRMRKMSLMSAEVCFLCHHFCCSLP